MVSSVSSVSTTPASTSASAPDPRTGAAYGAVKAMLEYLAVNSGATPGSIPEMEQLIWGLVNPNNAYTVSKSDMATAVLQYGSGGSAAVDDLWARVNPDNGHTINNQQFLDSNYLYAAVRMVAAEEAANGPSNQALASAAAANAPHSSSTVLDYFVGGGHHSGTILDSFA